MTRRALLIGSAVGGLAGTGNDTAAMAAALSRWGFDHPVVCDEENAGRAGILDAYERLISQTKQDDAVVVHYSGHGAYAKDPALAEGMPGPGVLQFVIPTDFKESTEDDFRGIANIELSLLLARLTERTRNVVVILDCCHSEAMSRDPETGGVAKVWPRPIPGYLARAHLDSLRRGGLDLSALDPNGNPDAVRVVACATNQQAFEAPNDDGVPMGYLTDAVTRVLNALDPDAARLSWATVADRVRQRVLDRCGLQRPEVEGPGERELFGIEPVDQVGSLPASRQRHWVRIAGARLLGYGEGDEFAIYHDEDLLGAVVVEWTDGHAVFGALRGSEPELELPVGARAQLVATRVAMQPVFLGAGMESLAASVREDPMLRVASAGESGAVRMLAQPGGVVLSDAVGPLNQPKPGAEVLEDLRRVARARAVARLSEDPGMALPAQVHVELARVVGGVAHPLPASGAALHPGQAVCVRVRNHGEQHLYVSLLDVGVSSRVELLNPAHPSGVLIAPRKEYVFGGDDATGDLPGLQLSWPSSVPAVCPRRERIVILISDERTDATVLRQGGVRGERQLNRLERQLRRLGPEGTRDLITPMLTRPVRFAVRTLDFEVVPSPAPHAEKAMFEVDDRPNSSVPRDETGVPARIAVRLPALLLHHNRSPRDPDFRLDTLITTTGADGKIRRHIHTERFTGTVDGTWLAMRDNPMFAGEVRAHLDLAVWVSPNPGAELDLSAAGGESTAELVDSVAALLAAGTGRVIGLYRAAFGAHERFGAARPRAESTVRTTDFTFDLFIDELPADGPSVLR